MSIRVRLIVMCLVVALLPAVPLTYIVKTLLDKSFSVGLNPTVEDALESGLEISRGHLDRARLTFSGKVQRVIGEFADSAPDSVALAAVVGRVFERDDDAGFALAPERADLRAFASSADLPAALAGERFTSPSGKGAAAGTTGLSFFETESRSYFIAVWDVAAMSVLFYARADSAFVAHADRLLAGRQIFAELRLTRERLAGAFFFPFAVTYLVVLALALVFALLMADRIARPIRRLVDGTGVVAGGDWSYRLDVRAGGETGRLVSAFNGMVARLDAQRRRLIDMEKMATWRDMARHLAHEIKNPLLPIRLTVEELKDQYKGDDTRYRDMLDESARIVGDELNHLQGLVREFSAFAKMPDMLKRTGSLPALVHDVATLYAQVKTDVRADGAVGEFAFDPDQMRRVLTNLYENTVAMAPDGGAEVTVTLARDGNDAVIRFADNGPGIAAEDPDRVFEPYFSRREGGTGLGLAMVKNIVLLHGGAIHAANAPGGGAVFTITLPMTKE